MVSPSSACSAGVVHDSFDSNLSGTTAVGDQDSVQPLANTQEPPMASHLLTPPASPQGAHLIEGRDVTRRQFPSISVELAQQAWRDDTRILNTPMVEEPSAISYAYPQESEKVMADGARCHPSHGPEQKRTMSGFSVSTTHTYASSLPPFKLVESKPEDSDRYQRPREYPPYGRIMLQKGPRSANSVRKVAPGWAEFIHLDGQLYYTTVIDSLAYGKSITLVTDYPLRIPENRPRMREAMEHLEDLLDRELADTALPLSCEVCLQLRSDEDNEWGYYMVDHEAQNIFFARSVTIEAIRLYVPENVDELVAEKLTIEYWRHVTDYPCHTSLPDKSWDVLSSMMTALSIDERLCEVSTAPSDSDTMITLQSLYQQAKSERDTASNRPYCTWVAARLWHHFLSARLVNYYGTDFARLERTTVVGDSLEPSNKPISPIWVWICWLLLWDEPRLTLKVLDQAWLGRVLYPKEWKRIMAAFTRDWEGILALDAVAFAEAMAFLALCTPSIANQSTESTNLPVSFSQLCGILSLILSVTSLVSALFLRSHFSGAIQSNVAVAADFLNSIDSSRHGYLSLGICLALPKVLTQWAICFFCLGFVFVALEIHQSRIGFFYAEIAFTVPLFAILVLQRRLSPQRIGGSEEVDREGLPGLQRSKKYAKRVGRAIKRRTTAVISAATPSSFNPTRQAQQQHHDPGPFNPAQKDQQEKYEKSDQHSNA